MEAPKNKVLFFDTYLAVIKNSVGTNMFRNFYMEIDGKKVDGTRDGVVSCAFFVTNVLNMFMALKLIKEPHLTVSSSVRDLKASGWTEIGQPRAGAILVWGPMPGANSKLIHGTLSERHIGFYVGNDLAVSNDPDQGVPDFHHWTFGNEGGLPVRKVEMILWNDALDGGK